jgi:hypothetical protein
MIEHLPPTLSLAFALITAATFLLLYLAILQSGIGKKKTLLIGAVLTAWLAIQAVVTLLDIYHSDTNAVPPKIVLFGILPALLAILALFVTRKGRQFIDKLPLKTITYLHVVRIPVELVLFWLYLHHAIPELMTFEGRNFDIFAGITAPIAALTLIKSRYGLLVWNIVCLGLLLNIVINALLSAPSPFQQFAFDQPNIAILYFPFSWLPAFVVPAVLFAHLVAIRRLTRPSSK